MSPIKSETQPISQAFFMFDEPTEALIINQDLREATWRQAQEDIMEFKNTVQLIQPKGLNIRTGEDVRRCLNLPVGLLIEEKAGGTVKTKDLITSRIDDLNGMRDILSHHFGMILLGLSNDLVAAQIEGPNQPLTVNLRESAVSSGLVDISRRFSVDREAVKCLSTDARFVMAVCAMCPEDLLQQVGERGLLVGYQVDNIPSCFGVITAAVSEETMRSCYNYQIESLDEKVLFPFGISDPIKCSTRRQELKNLLKEGTIHPVVVLIQNQPRNINPRLLF